jgi:hypothetical protein
MVGYVFTFDEFSAEMTDHSGVLVIALGKDNAYRTFTDKNGRFEFDDLPAGTYELQFLKEGFGTLKQFGIQHLGGEPTIVDMNFLNTSYTPAYYLFQIPSTEITSLNIENSKFTCSFKFVKEAPDYVGLTMYFSKVENFEVKDAQYVIPFQTFNKVGSRYISLDLGSFAKPGEKVYVRASVRPVSPEIMLFEKWIITGIDSYFDYESSQTIYPSLGKMSAQFSVTYPE